MLYDVHVDLEGRSYPIYIGADMRTELGSCIKDVGLSGACLVVADEHTGGLYGDQVVVALQAADFRRL